MWLLIFLIAGFSVALGFVLRTAIQDYRSQIRREREVAAKQSRIAELLDGESTGVANSDVERKAAEFGRKLITSLERHVERQHWTKDGQDGSD